MPKIRSKAQAKQAAIARSKQFAKRNPGLAELRKFINEFEKFPADIRKEIRPMIRRVGSQALLATRSESAWSTKIPRATRLNISFSKKTAGAAITTNRFKAPNARPMENRGREGFFRHPVNADKTVWVRQRSRPYISKATQPFAAKFDAEILSVVDQVARAHGFR